MTYDNMCPDEMGMEMDALGDDLLTDGDMLDGDDLLTDGGLIDSDGSGDGSQLYEHFRIDVDKGQQPIRIDKYMFEKRHS